LDSGRISLGAIQWNYGVKEYDFYNFLLGIGCALGISSNLILDRALVYPLERSKFMSITMPEDIATGKDVIIEN